MLELKEIISTAPNHNYDYEVLMDETCNINIFIHKVIYDKNCNRGVIYAIINDEKTRIATYSRCDWEQESIIAVRPENKVVQAKAKRQPDGLDFYCFIEVMPVVETDNRDGAKPITEMNFFFGESVDDNEENTLSQPEWQLDRKALDFIHDAEATGSYLKQIDMIDAVDSLELSKAIMKRLFQKLNRLRGHK